METITGCVFFIFLSRQIQNKHARMPYNKLLTNLASSSRTKEILALCRFLVLPRPRANIPQYCPRARLVRGQYSRVF